jgi:hypothetical protein
MVESDDRQSVSGGSWKAQFILLLRLWWLQSAIYTSSAVLMVYHNTLQTLGSLEQALRRSRGTIIGEAVVVTRHAVVNIDYVSCETALNSHDLWKLNSQSQCLTQNRHYYDIRTIDMDLEVAAMSN